MSTSKGRVIIAVLNPGRQFRSHSFLKAVTSASVIVVSVASSPVAFPFTILLIKAVRMIMSIKGFDYTHYDMLIRCSDSVL